MNYSGIGRAGGYPNFSGSMTAKGATFVFTSNKGKRVEQIENGGDCQNPFQFGGIVHSGDLAEFMYGTVASKGNKVKLFKVFKASAAAVAGVIKILDDGRSHKPEVGNIVMVAPATLAGTGTGYAITKVDTLEDGWNITIDSAAVVAKDAILVEATAVGASATMYCKPNCFVASDYAMNIPVNNFGFTQVTYTLGNLNSRNTAYLERMSYVPACVVTALNKSNIAGLFEL